MTTFKDALERMDRYIWYWANKYSKTIHNMEVDDLRQEGLLKLYEIYCGSDYQDKGVEELDEIFKAALVNRFGDLYRAYKVRSRNTVDLEDVSGELSIEAFGDVFLAYYQTHLNQYLSEGARLLLDTLLHPTPAVYHLHNIQVMRRQRVQKQDKSAWRVPTRPTLLVVGKALGMKPWQVKKHVQELQHAWQTYGCQANR